MAPIRFLSGLPGNREADDFAFETFNLSEIIAFLTGRDEDDPEPRQAGLETADDRIPSDMMFTSPPFASETEAPDEDPDAAGARGGSKGKPTDDGTTSGGGPKKGKGWNKDDTTDTADTTGGDGGTTPDDGTASDGGTADTGGSDTGGTDTGGTDTGGTTTDPAPVPGGNTYVSGLDTPDGFNIELEFFGDWSDSQKDEVIRAAEDISDIVTGDLPSYNGIDDVYISANLTDIDGSGGYWGWGGTTSLRPDSMLTSEGYLRFDSADIASIENYYGTNFVYDLAYHEMLHSLGFGLTWDEMGLVEDHGGDLRFTGENATEAYNTYFTEIAANDPLSAIGVPIETDGGSGTAGKHWDEATFTDELMTGDLSFQGYMSDMSIAALEDMGYETIWEPAEEEDPLAFV